MNLSASHGKRHIREETGTKKWKLDEKLERVYLLELFKYFFLLYLFSIDMTTMWMRKFFFPELVIIINIATQNRSMESLCYVWMENSMDRFSVFCDCL